MNRKQRLNFWNKLHHNQHNLNQDLPSFHATPSQNAKATNYLELDDYMTSLDDKSLNKLTTAQLMQRLKAHNLEWRGLKHELIKRWRDYKSKEQESQTSQI